MFRRYGYNKDGSKRKKPTPRAPDPAALPAMQQCMLKAVPWTSISEWLLELEERFEEYANNSVQSHIAYNKEVIDSLGRRTFGRYQRMAPTDRYLKCIYANADVEDQKNLTVLTAVKENHWQRELRRLQAGYYVADTHVARKDAAAQLRQSMDAFTRRAALKMIAQGGEDPTKVTGDIVYTGRHLIATIFFTSKDGKPFKLTCKTKTNYRYGENSINGYMTIYLQYPFKVVEGPFTINQE